ncbi:DUF4241 domain-containing protein [Brevibacillus sp. HB1.2]|uniref:DUF4241 domain-containing protein n=1 Tax=Brevibacillus sp. HB1.2 TaxID=2738807 RepID=UPI000362483F|nr:DUF4241 domain-containing protein [Brevibacillus sp. HB1.2]ATF13483.1 DUF4241 domain-containing protein [Brevibacillus brevis X23]NTU18773.1 DUF4241 domain-containing protein [Brevibacillus sp. HB1.2]
MKHNYPAFFETAFDEGYTIEQDGYLYRLFRQDMGKLQVKTGKIVANDPFVMFETEPFEEVFPKGSFSVQLAIAQVQSLSKEEQTDDSLEPDERVALARIAFSDKPVVSWKMAVWAESDVSQLGEGEFFGYGVDAGTGSFMDAEACALLEREMEKDEMFYETLTKKMDQTYKHTRSWGLINIGEGCNVAMFSTGWGDGSYASYIGYDAEGQIARLVTDFYLLNWMGTAEE